MAVWLLLVPFALLFAPRLTDHLQSGGFTNPRSEGHRAVQLLREELGGSLSTLSITFLSPDVPVRDPGVVAELGRVLAPLERHPAVERVHTWASMGNERLVSPDGHVTYALVGLNVDTAAAQRLLPELKALLPPSSLQVWVTGGPAAYADIERVSHRDLQQAETISLPLAATALILVFGGLAAAAVPVVIGAISVLATLAVLYFVAQATDVSIFAQNIATMLGLGISIDYALLIVSRYREELRDPDRTAPALPDVMSTAGKAVFFSGSTVLLGLLGLMTFDYMMLRSVGLAGAIVVAVAVSASLTLLPALLVLLGPRIDALSTRFPHRGGGAFTHREAAPGFWLATSALVARHPLGVLLAVIAVLVALGVPFLRVRLGAPDVTVLPADVESRQGFDLLRERFGPGEIAPIFVVVEAEDGILEPENVGALYDYTRAIESLPGVVRIDSIVNVDPAMGRAQYQFLYSEPSRISDPAARQALSLLAAGRIALVTVVSEHAPVAPEAQDLVRRIRGMSPGSGFSVYVGGAAAELMDIVADLYGQFPRALAFIVITTYLVLALQFRSLVLPGKAVLMDTLSILASYGALVLVFQDGHLSGLLGFVPEGVVDATVPIVMFCVLFGLSMDYEVFMLSRIQEVYLRTGDNSLAVTQGLRQTGRIITSAALIIIVVSASFATAGIIIIKALGIGMAIAIALDATIVRLLLVPAAMHLLGRGNWWPGPRMLGPGGRPPASPARF